MDNGWEKWKMGARSGQLGKTGEDGYKEKTMGARSKQWMQGVDGDRQRVRGMDDRCKEQTMGARSGQRG